jgi:hypothetical protein
LAKSGLRFALRALCNVNPYNKGFFMKHQNGTPREHVNGALHSLISWKSIIAGFLVSMLTYVTLTSLGLAIGGASTASVIQNGGAHANGLAIGAGVWVALTVLLSLAAGAYFAARTSTFITARVGAAQGLIIAALFFGGMIYGLGDVLGLASQGLGSAAGSAASKAGSVISSSPMMRTVLEDSLVTLKLKSDPEKVAQGLMARISTGNTDSAKNYLAAQTGLSQTEVNTEFDRIENQVKAAAVKTADGVSKGAWVSFWALFLGLAASVFAGAAGSVANFRSPLTNERVSHSRQAHPAY